MKKYWLVICLGGVLFSCGSKKAVVTRKPKKEVEQVVVKEKEPQIESGTKVVTKSYASDVERYIDTYKDIAKEEMRMHKIPASITIAQGILESNSGKARLSVQANNHFGIKCHNWTGPRIYHDDDAKGECFRKYTDARDSFKDHSLFLSGRKRYAGLFKLRITDYKSWAKGLKVAGYATDKKYPDKLISIIERYELYKFDKDIGNIREPRETIVKVPVKEKEVVVEKADLIHIVKKDDTLYSLSKKYKTTVQELQRINGIKGTTISVGQELFVELASKK